MAMTSGLFTQYGGGMLGVASQAMMNEYAARQRDALMLMQREYTGAVPHHQGVHVPRRDARCDYCGRLWTLTAREAQTCGGCGAPR